jgi:hypothetical protein
VIAVLFVIIDRGLFGVPWKQALVTAAIVGPISALAGAAKQQKAQARLALVLCVLTRRSGANPGE